MRAVTGQLPVENQALCFVKGLVYGEEEAQMCAQGSDLHLRDARFVAKNVFFLVFLEHPQLFSARYSGHHICPRGHKPSAGVVGSSP